MKFIDKQLALKLKEKGFDRPCLGWYYIKTPTGRNDGELILNTSKTRGVAYEDLLCSHNDNFIEYVDNYVDAPTIDQVLEWLREEKYIYFTIYINVDFMFRLEINMINKEKTHLEWFDLDIYNSYDDAILVGIEYVVEHLI